MPARPLLYAQSSWAAAHARPKQIARAAARAHCTARHNRFWRPDAGCLLPMDKCPCTLVIPTSTARTQARGQNPLPFATCGSSVPHPTPCTALRPPCGWPLPRGCFAPVWPASALAGDVPSPAAVAHANDSAAGAPRAGAPQHSSARHELYNTLPPLLTAAPQLACRFCTPSCTAALAAAHGQGGPCVPSLHPHACGRPLLFLTGADQAAPQLW